MSGTNDSFTFGSSAFSDFEFSELPKGCCFALTMNPYNGLVVAQYNHSQAGVFVVDSLLSQIEHQRAFLSDALECDVSLRDIADYCEGRLVVPDFEQCPFCGGVPDYVEPDVGSFGVIVCCGGRLRFDGFSSRAQAVRSWNDRSAFRVKVA